MTLANTVPGDVVGNDRDPLVGCLMILARLNGLAASENTLTVGLPLQEGRLTPALFERVNGRTRWQLLLRSPSRPTLRRVLGALRPHLQADRDVLTIVDVDPQTLV